MSNIPASMLALDADTLAIARTKVDDPTLIIALNNALHSALKALIDDAARREALKFRSLPDFMAIRFFKSEIGVIYVCWNDACKVAQVSNSVLEARKLTRIMVPVGRDARDLALVTADGAEQWLRARRVRGDAATRAADAIRTVINTHGTR